MRTCEPRVPLLLSLSSAGTRTLPDLPRKSPRGAHFSAFIFDIPTTLSIFFSLVLFGDRFEFGFLASFLSVPSFAEVLRREGRNFPRFSGIPSYIPFIFPRLCSPGLTLRFFFLNHPCKVFSVSRVFVLHRLTVRCRSSGFPFFGIILPPVTEVHRHASPILQ